MTTPVMPFGKHKGERLVDVPRSYLKWLSEQEDLSVRHPRIAAWIVDWLERPEPAWTHNTRMPFGKYKGEELMDLLPSYCLWLLAQDWIDDWPGLKQYLVAEEESLRRAYRMERWHKTQEKVWGKTEY